MGALPTTDAKGRQAERLAQIYLLGRGYQPLAARFKTPVGEIDLIVRNFLPWRAPVLAFVEVKRRPTLDEAAESIHARQRQRIGQAAEWYLQRHPPDPKYALRYDAVFVVPGAWPRHVENAWPGSGPRAW